MFSSQNVRFIASLLRN